MNFHAISHRNIEQGTLLIDIATRNVIRLAPDDSVGEAARIMAEKRISSIVVTDEDGHPSGIVTEHNMLHAMQSRCPPETMLRKVMTSPVITVPAAITCLDAYQVCLRDGIRHLVIVSEDKQLLGVVSETDFRQHINLSVLAGRRQVASVMSRSVFIQSPEASLKDALDLMQSHRDTCIVAVEAERPIGIVTERDIVRLYSDNPGRTDISIREVMTSPVLTISQESSINEAAECMLTAKVRHLVVVDHAGQMAGLLSEHDLTHTMALRLIDDKLIAEGAFLRTLVNTIPDMVWLKDMNGIYRACNPRFERFFDAKEKEIIGKTDYDFVDKELADSIRAHDGITMGKNEPTVYEEWGTYADDGHRELLETIKTPMRDSQGKLIGILGISRDITERKNMEEALAKSEYRYRTLVEISPFCIHEIDLEGRIQSMNRAGLDMLQLDEERKVCGIPYLNTVSEQDSSRIKALLQDALNGTASHFEFAASGDTSLYFKSCFIPVMDADSNILKLMGLTENITERKLVEQALLENEAKLRIQKESLDSIFENALDAVMLMDSEGAIIGWSSQAETIFGWSREEAVGRLMSETIVPCRYREAHTLGMKRFLATGEGPALNTRIEVFALHREGHEFPIELSIAPIKTANGYEFSSFIRDISERKRAEEEIIFKNTILQTLKETTLDAILVVDENAQIISYNQQFVDLWRLSSQLVNAARDAPVLQFVAAQVENSEAFVARVLYLYQHRNDKSREEIRLKDGRILDRYSAPITGADGKYYGRVWYFRDVSEIKRAEENLRITASVFENSQEAILITDANNVIMDVNPAFTRITGYSREEVLGRNPKLMNSGRQDKAFFIDIWQSLKQNRTWRGEIWNRRKSGEVYAELLSIASICDDDGNVLRYIGVFSDISYLKEHEAELSHVAHYDALTGIPNRVLLADRMKQAIAQTAREQNVLAICYLDLDGFKSINDTLGHDAGDQVLVEVARRIENTIRGGDTVARLGGDEFVVLLGLEKGEECVATLERLLAGIAQPIIVKDKPQMLSASIGVSIYPLDHEDSDTLLRHADQAMYIAKQAGKNCFYIYDSELDLRARNHNEFLKSIRYGLENNQFELYFQPKVNLCTRQLVGAEALIRWRHFERGLLSPLEFVRPIENTELDIEIGNWVITTALAQLNRWHFAGLDIEVSINISAYHLESPDFVGKLRQQLIHYPDLPPGKLQIEILETAALNDLSIVSEIIEECSKFGVGFALDDFGTGYSSLSYLSKLPVEVLKIDQSFVRDMLIDKGDKAIVQGVISLALAFERQVVAEGIETIEHYLALLDMGCQLGQGYGIARPMPADELTIWQMDDSGLR